MSAKPLSNIAQTSKRDWLPWLLIAIGLGVFANSLSGMFVYDDVLWIRDNKNIRTLWPFYHLFLAPPDNPVEGRPVIALSLAVNYAVGGLQTFGYHVVNIAVHLLNSLVLFGIIRRTLKGPALSRRFGHHADGLAMACALLWMVHPLQTECVNYITQRTESIMGMFYLLTLYCAIRGLDSPHRRRWYATSVLCCALGMASKEVMVSAPLMVMLYDFAFLRGSAIVVPRQRRRLYLGLAATWLVLAALMLAFPHAGTVGFAHLVNGWDYAKHQCVMITNYLRLVVWPDPLVLDYGKPAALLLSEVVPYGFVVLGLLVASLVALVYWPPAGFCGMWFFLILGPSSSFVPLVTEVGAERRMYLPLASPIVLLVIGGYLLLGLGLRWLQGTGPTKSLSRSPGGDLRSKPLARSGDRPQRGSRIGSKESSSADVLQGWLGIALVVAVAGALAARTIHRNADYHSVVRIWETVVSAVPENERAHYTLGVAHLGKGDLPQAEKHIVRALQLNPQSALAYFNLGVVRQQQGESDRALALFVHALQIAPDLGQAKAALQRTVAQLRDDCRQALRTNPGDAEAHYRLGSVYAAEGQMERALDHYRQALDLGADAAKVHINIAHVLSTQQQLEAAATEYAKALEADPRNVQAYYNLGNLLAQQGKLQEAAVQFERALEINPTFHAARQKLTLIRKGIIRTKEPG